MKLNVVYAHCTKATVGQPDRNPWYQYELREAPATLEMQRITYDDSNGHEWCGSTEDGKFRCVEDSQHEAVQELLYKLMDNSRKEAELEFLKAANTGLEQKPLKQETPASTR